MPTSETGVPDAAVPVRTHPPVSLTRHTLNASGYSRSPLGLRAMRPRVPSWARAAAGMAAATARGSGGASAPPAASRTIPIAVPSTNSESYAAYS